MTSQEAERQYLADLALESKRKFLRKHMSRRGITMTSYEADKFMLEHPEVAVRRYGEGAWQAWDHLAIKGELPNQTQGFTRESAIANYQHIYHSACPPEKPPNNYSRYADMVQAFADSAKYRKIVDLFKEIDEKAVRPTSAWTWTYLEDVRRILRGDLESHCDKCHQKLSKIPTLEGK